MSRRLALATGVLAALLSCTACGGNDATQGAPTISTPGGSSPAAPSSAPPTAGGDSSRFCTTARQVGLRNVQIEDSGNADLSRLLDGLDTLDALAPPDLKPDFDRFVGLEKALLDPANAPTGAAGNINNPDNLTALGHVEKYLQDTCGLAQ